MKTRKPLEVLGTLNAVGYPLRITNQGRRTMTKQELFDRAATHLLRQNKRSRVKNVNRYRTPTGLACPVGVFIPEDLYKTKLEQCDVGDFFFVDEFSDKPHHILARKIAKEVGFDEKRHYQLLFDLQFIHDVCEVEDWRDELRALARQHKLNQKAIKAVKKGGA